MMYLLTCIEMLRCLLLVLARSLLLELAVVLLALALERADHCFLLGLG